MLGDQTQESRHFHQTAWKQWWVKLGPLLFFHTDLALKPSFQLLGMLLNFRALGYNFPCCFHALNESEAWGLNLKTFCLFFLRFCVHFEFLVAVFSQNYSQRPQKGKEGKEQKENREGWTHHTQKEKRPYKKRKRKVTIVEQKTCYNRRLRRKNGVWWDKAAPSSSSSAGVTGKMRHIRTEMTCSISFKQINIQLQHSLTAKITLALGNKANLLHLGGKRMCVQSLQQGECGNNKTSVVCSSMHV